MITAGNMQALNALFHVVLEEDDEIILTDPGFASHFQQIRLCGGNPVSWPLDESRGWSLDIDSLPDLISDKTKAILLVSPSNPTGSIFREDELRRVADVAARNDLLILLDDPYSHLTYENQDLYFNLAAAAEYKDRVAYCFTFSKIHAMSGWRLGYMIVPESLKRQVMKVHDARLSARLAYHRSQGCRVAWRSYPYTGIPENSRGAQVSDLCKARSGTARLRLTFCHRAPTTSFPKSCRA